MSTEDDFRVDLDVPYAEHQEAKRCGAFWDHVRKVWYAPSPTVLSRCERWHRVNVVSVLDNEALDHLSDILSEGAIQDF